MYIRVLVHKYQWLLDTNLLGIQIHVYKNVIHMKKALITVKLVPEASKESNSQIEKEIRADSQISWCAQIEKVEIMTADSKHQS